MEDKKYSIQDFIYWIEKYNDLYESKYTKEQIARKIAEGMLDFFEE